MARINNSLPAFLLALRASVVNADVVPSTCCQIVTEERYLEYPQGQYIVMMIPGPLRPEDQGGEGENETIFLGTITFRIICQNAVDSPISDQAALTATFTTTGLYQIFQELLSAIRFWDQCDANGNQYLMQPLRIASGLSQPRRDPQHEQYIFAELSTEYKICIAG